MQLSFMDVGSLQARALLAAGQGVGVSLKVSKLLVLCIESENCQQFLTDSGEIHRSCF